MMEKFDVTDRILGGLWGAIIGDALGVPVEFKPREEVRRNPVTGMRGFGTFSLPPGLWSDDSSLSVLPVSLREFIPQHKVVLTVLQ